MAEPRKWTVWFLEPGESKPSGFFKSRQPSASAAAEEAVEWFVQAETGVGINGDPIRVHVLEEGSYELLKFDVTVTVTAKAVCEENETNV